MSVTLAVSVVAVINLTALGLLAINLLVVVGTLKQEWAASQLVASMGLVILVMIMDWIIIDSEMWRPAVHSEVPDDLWDFQDEEWVLKRVMRMLRHPLPLRPLPDGAECSICMEPINEGVHLDMSAVEEGRASVRISPVRIIQCVRCGHAVHTECICRCVNAGGRARCPTCLMGL